MNHELDPLTQRAKEALGGFVGAAAHDIGLVVNATTGINAVLRSLRLAPGDELLITDHTYPAVRNSARWVAERAGADVRVAAVPFPITEPGDVVAAVLDAVSSRTRLAVIDHVTSPTALVWPIDLLVAELDQLGVDTLVDGAHAPGMVPLDLTALGAAYYTGNCHKWMCTPKGAGFLWARPDRQASVVPTVISHGWSDSRPEQPWMPRMFDWAGTVDPTAWLVIPEAIACMAATHDDGWAGVMAANRDVALAARRIVVDALGIPTPAPDTMVGSMASIPLPPAERPPDAHGHDPLQAELEDRGYRVPVPVWPAFPDRLIRLSAQRYNDIGQFERLARDLGEILRR